MSFLEGAGVAIYSNCPDNLLIKLSFLTYFESNRPWDVGTDIFYMCTSESTKLVPKLSLVKPLQQPPLGLSYERHSNVSMFQSKTSVSVSCITVTPIS